MERQLLLAPEHQPSIIKVLKLARSLSTDPPTTISTTNLPLPRLAPEIDPYQVAHEY